jgi:hypothetical protein
MAFTQTNVQPVQTNALQQFSMPTLTGWTGYQTAPFGWQNQFQPVQPQQPMASSTPTFNYTPPPINIPQGLASLVQGDLYSNPSAPWAIPAQVEAQTPTQPTGNAGGWDSSAFMQGLQSLNMPGV